MCDLLELQLAECADGLLHDRREKFLGDVVTALLDVALEIDVASLHEDVADF